MPLVYDTLRRIAGNLMRQERKDHTLQPTALVNEAYMRLVDIKQVDWKGRAHFCNMAAKQMRRILVDHARKRDADKRGGQFARVTLDDEIPLGAVEVTDLLALDQALNRLAKRNSRHGRVAEMRIFSGLRVKEVAYVLGVSEKTVTDDWQFIRVWIAKELDLRER